MMLAEQACCNLVKQPQAADKYCAVLELVAPVFPLPLFPGGTLPSPRWQPFVRIAAACIALLVLAAMLTPAPSTPATRSPTRLARAAYSPSWCWPWWW
jgi:hypothetical protein